MARFARAMYEAGAGQREVLHACYDVELPDEFFALAADPELFEDTEYNGVSYGMPPWTNQPWQMAVPLEWGGPDPEADGLDRIEQWLLAVDPGFLPLLDHTDRWPVPGGQLLCYHIDELLAGRPAVFGVPPGYDGGTAPPRVGGSLLEVLLGYQRDVVRAVEKEYAAAWGPEADEDRVAVSKLWLARLERVQRRLSGG